MGTRVTRAQWNSEQVDKLHPWLAEEIHGYQGKITIMTFGHMDFMNVNFPCYLFFMVLGWDLGILQIRK